MSTTAPFLNPDSFGEGLPDALKDLVNRVVRKTRLWPSERRDVKAELESHFREGLIELTGEGLSLSESIAHLRDDFGDPQLAAQLIRRGKKRGRPMIWKALVSVVAVCGVTLCAGAGYVAYVTFGKPNPTVDYVAKINEPVQKLPAEERAWPLLREVIFDMLPTVNTFSDSTLQSAKPGDATWPGIAADIARLRPFVPRLVDAAAKPYWGYVYGKEGGDYLQRRSEIMKQPTNTTESVDPLVPPTIGMLLPHLTDVRNVGRFLTQNAREHIANGEFTQAWISLDVIHQLGLHLMSGRTLIEQLVGAAMIRLATQEMQSTLYAMRDRITPAMLTTIRNSHVMTASLDPIQPHLKAEEFFFNDVVQYLFTDDGNGNGRLIPSQFSKIAGFGTANAEQTSEAGAIAIAAVHADRHDTVAKYHETLDHVVEFLSLPLYDSRRAEADAIITKLANDAAESKRFAVIHLLFPVFSRVDMTIRETRQSVLATRTIVGLLGYNAEHQSMPARLAEITPKYLCELPTDIFSGMLFKYVPAADGSFMLYSVGHNLTDDGGSRESILDPMNRGSNTDKDLVYWPGKQ
ncbi:MAG: hypothetical protein HZA51_11310 [Planctomycetes bacterium]|nr:hypothetical protein [Planctomycetota bacterium]